MKTAGVIVELNPMHSGHEYLFRKARELTGADCLVVVQSGDFVQRGEPAVCDMHSRAEMALRNGADLVLELPVRFSSSSAESFSFGSVSLLDSLGCVDFLVFGSEAGSLQPLKEAADILLSEPEDYKRILKAGLKAGLSFPAAREAALKDCESSSLSFGNTLKTPNNILGIEYLKALSRLGSSIEPVTVPRNPAFLSSREIRRLLNDAHTQEAGSEYPFISGTESSAVSGSESPAVSGPESPAVFGTESLDVSEPAEDVLPASVWEILKKNRGSGFPVTADDFSSVLRYALILADRETLPETEGMTEALSDRILRLRNRFVSFTSFTDLLKTRNLTRTAVSRALLHLILGIAAEPELSSAPGYARILGFRQSASELLHTMGKTARIPLLSKAANAEGLLSPADFRIFQEDIRSSHIYHGIAADKFRIPFRNEYTRKIVVLHEADL